MTIADQLAYIPGIDAYSDDPAADRGAATVERHLSKLTRSDGSRVYSDAEHTDLGAHAR